ELVGRVATILATDGNATLEQGLDEMSSLSSANVSRKSSLEPRISSLWRSLERIKILDLSECKLPCIPYEIFDLKFLECLHLRKNYIAEIIPGASEQEADIFVSTSSTRASLMSSGGASNPNSNSSPLSRASKLKESSRNTSKLSGGTISSDPRKSRRTKNTKN